MNDGKKNKSPGESKKKEYVELRNKADKEM